MYHIAKVSIQSIYRYMIQNPGIDYKTCVCLLCCRYGVVLKKLDLIKEAVEMFTEAAHKAPLHWGTWLELVLLISDKEMVC